MVDFLRLERLSNAKLIGIACFYFDQFVLFNIAYMKFHKSGLGFDQMPVNISTGEVVRFFLEGGALQFALDYLIVLLVAYVGLGIITLLIFIFDYEIAKNQNKSPIEVLISARALQIDEESQTYCQGDKYTSIKRLCFDSEDEIRVHAKEYNSALGMTYLLIALAAFTAYGIVAVSPYIAVVASFGVTYQAIRSYAIFESVKKCRNLFVTAPIPPDQYKPQAPASVPGLTER